MDLKLTYAITDDTKNIYITDEGSEWGNPDRSAVALLCLVQYMGMDRQDYILTSVSYDNTLGNEEITSFVSDYIRVGLHRLVLAVIPLTAAEQEGSIRYSTLSSQVEIYTDGNWETLTDFDLITADNTIYAEVNVMLYSKHTVSINCLWLDIVNNRCKDKKCSLEKFWFVRGQLFSLLNQFATGNRWEAQRMIENIEKATAGI